MASASRGRGRHPSVVRLLGAAASAWGTFIVLGLVASLIVGASLDGGPIDPGLPAGLAWLLWAVLVAMVSAIPAAIAVLVLAPLMFLIARRLQRPVSWLPLTSSAVVGAVVALFAVLLILSDGGSSLAVLRVEFLAAALLCYGVAGGLSGVVGWLVLTREARHESDEHHL